MIRKDPGQLKGAEELEVTFPEREELPIKIPLTIRKPSEILAMEFDDSERIIGDNIVALEQPTTILGAGGLGKSRLAIQAAAASIANRSFLSLRTYRADLRWLFVQGENTNRRLKADLEAVRSWIGKSWQAFDDSVVFHTLESDDDGYLTLDVGNQSRVSDLVSEVKPDVIVYDTLNCFAVGDPNSDKDMRDTCQNISRISKRGNPKRAVIVLHHALTGRSGASKATGWDRSGFGRNSKTLLAWTRAQINVAPGSPDDNESLVISCGKCSNGKEFEPFAVRLNPKTMIYEVDPNFDLAGWEAEVNGKKSEGPLITPERIRELASKPMTKLDLSKAIIADCGCGRTYAYKLIDKAVNARAIHHNKINETFVSK